MRMSGPRRAILRSLVIRSGDIVDTAGFATAELLADPEVGRFPPQSVRRAVADLERAGLVAREVSGRRVYRIGLTAEGRAAAEARGLRPEEPYGPGRFAEVLESNDRRMVLAAIAAVTARLQEWATSVDLSQPPDQLRVEMFNLLLGPMVSGPPTSDELALAILRANAHTEALLAAYRERDLDIDRQLVESTIATTVQLARRLAATAAALSDREPAASR